MLSAPLAIRNLPETFPVYPAECVEPYTAKIYRPDDTEGLSKIAELDAAAFAGQVSLDIEELQAIARNGVVLGILDSNGALAVEAQIITEPMDNAAEPALENMPENYAYLAGIAKSKSTKIRGAGSLAILLCEDIIRVAYPSKNTMLSSARPENIPILTAFTRLGHAGLALNGDYFPHYRERDITFPAPSLARHTGARIMTYRNIRTSRSRLGCQGIDCSTVDVHTSDEPNAMARWQMARRFADGASLTGIEKQTENNGYSAHMCKIPVHQGVILPPYH